MMECCDLWQSRARYDGRNNFK